MKLRSKKIIFFGDTLSADNDSYQKLKLYRIMKWLRSTAFIEKRYNIRFYAGLVRFSCEVNYERVCYLLKLIV